MPDGLRVVRSSGPRRCLPAWRARELEVLYALTAAVHARDLGTTLTVLAQRARLLPATHQATILLPDGEGRLVGRVTTAALDAGTVTLPAGGAGPEDLVVLRDPAAAPPGLDPLFAAGAHTLLRLRLDAHGEVLGVLVLGSRLRRAYRADRVRALRPMLDRLADRLTARLLRHRQTTVLAAEARRQRLRAVHGEIVAACSLVGEQGAGPEGDAIQAFAAAVARQIGDGCAVLVPDGDVLRPVAVADVDPGRARAWLGLLRSDPVDAALGAARTVLQTARPVVLRDFGPTGEPLGPPAWQPFLSGLAGHGIALLPLRARNRVVGVLVAHRAVPYQDDEVALLGELADRMALSLANADLDAERLDAMLELEAGRERYRLALERMHDPVVLCAPVPGPDGTPAGFEITFANSAHVAAGGKPPGTVLHEDGLPRGWAAVPAALQQAWEHGGPVRWERLPFEVGGRIRYADGESSRVGDEVLISWRDVTDERRAAKELAAAAELFRSAFDDAPIATGLVSLEPGHIGEVLQVNKVLEELTGYAAADLVGEPCFRLTHLEDRADDERHLRELADGTARHYQREKRLVRADGRTIWTRLTVAVVGPEGAPKYAVKHVEDITARRNADEELIRRALYDPLTGLPNRHLLMDHLALAVQEQPRRGGAVGVLYLDVDRFKQINDTYGHEAGDEVIRHVGSRLAATVRAPDTAARLAGDEFVVIGHLQAESDGARFAERIQAALQTPVRIGTVELVIAASVGVATARTPSVTPRELLRRADLAMYDAKRRGPGLVVVFDGARHDTAKQRGSLELQLRSALDEDRLQLHYQPIVDVRDGRIVAVEALLRVGERDGSLLPPQEFIDVAEDSDLILLLGDWVLQHAAAQAAVWHRIDPALEVAVNVSGRQASRSAVTEQVVRAADEAGLPPSGLSIEITENVLIDGGASVVEDLTRLTELGVGLALDDFGTGYSSLTYLRNLPVDTVKIDRSFVAGLGRHAGDTAIVEAVSALGRALGLRTVAEGVEDAGQLAVLREMGCTHAQGFGIGRPMPAEELTQLLTR